MTKSKWKTWIWYGVVAAVVTGLFVPTMIASAGASKVPNPTETTCPTPK